MYGMSEDSAWAKKAALEAEFPKGPPEMFGSGKTFVRFAVRRWGNREGVHPYGWGIVVRWRYTDKPETGEMGGAFVWFEHGRPTTWNFN